jgi:hypothetical protein
MGALGSGREREPPNGSGKLLPPLVIVLLMNSDHEIQDDDDIREEDDVCSECEAKGYDYCECTFYDEDDDTEPWEDDVWADADALASAGWGTDEDYGYFGGDDY